MVSSRKIPDRTLLLGCLPVLLTAYSCSIAAQAGEYNSPDNGAAPVFAPYASIGIHYDDNLLRLPDNTGEPVADRWTHTLLGIKIDKRISRQRVTADASIARNDYDRFSVLDNTARDLKFNWNWAVGNHVEGNAGATYSRAQTPFEDSRFLEPNLRTQRRTYTDVAWRAHPDWSLNASYSRYDLDYDLQSQRPGARTLDVAEVGVDYLAHSGNKIGVLFSHVEGDYRFAPINSYSQDELKAKIDWQLSGKTFVQFLGGYATRNYGTNATRDSDGLNGRFNGYWKATGKTALAISAWREIGATEDLAANYAINKGISLAGAWDATDKIRIDGALMGESRDYNGVAIVAGIPPSDRQDRYRRASAGISYKPLARLDVRTSVYRETLSSNQPQSSYRANGIQVTSRYEF